MKLTLDLIQTMEEAEREYKRLRTAYTNIRGDSRCLSDEERSLLNVYVADLFRVISSPAVHDDIRRKRGKTGTLWERAAQLQTEIIINLEYEW